MTKQPKVLFNITIAMFQDSCSSHIPCPLGGSSFPFVFLVLANTTPNNNWGEVRDLHQCLPQGIASKDYMEEKMNMKRKYLSKNLLQKKKKFLQKVRLE